MAIVLLLALAIVLIVNVILIAGFYFLSAAILYPFKKFIEPIPSRWRRRAARAGLAAILMAVVPLVLNISRHHERSVLTSQDKIWEGTFSNPGVVALLSDRLENGAIEPGWWLCEMHRCKGLLYGNKTTAFLIGSPPAVGAPLEPTLKVVRYRIERRDWCPPLEDIDNHHDGRNLAELTRLAQGECLVGEPTTLGEADVVIVDQPLNPPRRPDYHSVHEALTGQRLSLHKRDGSGWRELFRRTEVGGSDWSIPMHVGFLDRNLFGAMMFGGGLVGFSVTNIAEAKPIDIEAKLASWDLSSPQGVVAARSEMEPLVRDILANPSLPSESAAMQFLATYVWLDDWNGKDRTFQAAIIRDRRVTEFPSVPWDRATPAELADPILDRIMSTDLTEADLPSAHPHGNRRAVRILAEVFSLLPAGSAAPMREQLMMLAADKLRRQYVPAIFSRLADGGPSNVAYLESLIRTGLEEGRAAPDKRAWATGDGCVVALVVYGLARLGSDAQSALPIVMDAVTDRITKAYPGNELLIASYLALLHMGKLDVLATVWPGGSDFARKQLDRNARWNIGQCGRG